MHDFAALEAQGVVAAFVASAVFETAAGAQAAALGYREVPSVFVAHPIQDRTDDEMRALADKALDSILATVTR